MTRYNLLFVAIFIAALMILANCGEDPGSPYNDNDDEEERPSDDPVRYHGRDAEDPFFEGWYLNVSDSGQGASHAVILGIMNPNQTSCAYSTAFVIATDMSAGNSLTGLFPVDEFDASVRKLDVHMGDEISLDQSGSAGSMQGDGHSVSWNLEFIQQIRWDRTMGILTDVPGIAMNWDVHMINGRAAGWIEMDGLRVEYDNAHLYGDHNWGTVFPDRYSWGQANYFPDPNDCLAFSGGDVPLGDLTLEGYMIGYRRGVEFFEIRSQDGDVIRHSYEDGVWIIEAVEGKKKLVITGVADPADMVLLPAPRPDGLIPFANQTLNGVVTVEVFEREGLGWKLLDTNTSNPAALERASN